MPDVNKAPVWYPPPFPLQGRLPQGPEQVEQNLRRQCEMERDYHDALCVAAGFRVARPCCKTLHISLFFDGTGNNLNNDLYESAIPHPTNIARLFRATIGAGHTGGTAHSARASGLTDSTGVGHGQYYKYYMPGVGTPFTEVGDLDYSSDGLAFARRGEERINWGLLMIIDALRRALGLPRRDNTALKAAVEAMGTWHGTEWIMGRANRASLLRRELKALEGPLRIALTPALGQPRLLGVRLYVFGFSRGAAAARAFVSWLNQLLSPQATTPALQAGSLLLPVSVAYLGLLDTVVSVGLADIAPGANGHMGWGDGSQELPKGALVKRCLHIVASHEQRLSFPLESIRREDGTYPSNSVEVIYPGGIATREGGIRRGIRGRLLAKATIDFLSQIALNDLYSDAFNYGAPFKVPEGTLPSELIEDAWRIMGIDLVKAFDVSPSLLNRFNAWRQTTLEVKSGSDYPSQEQGANYCPAASNFGLESTLREQMSWLTAWRIDRYAFSSLKDTEFYRQASDEHATDQARQRAEAERDRKQGEVEKRRELQQFLERRGAPKKPLEPGIKDFDPDKSKTQLREAAEEFGRLYRDLDSDPYLTFVRHLRKVSVPAFIIISWNIADKLAEHARLKAAGQAKVSQLFPPPTGQQNHTSESQRGPVDESLNREQPTGLLRALFDDQVHDSRAWFLHALLNDKYAGQSVAAGREPWGSYFTERMVFFGEANRRDVAWVPGDQGAIAVALAPADIGAETPEQRYAQNQERVHALWAAHVGKASGGQNV